MREIVQIWKDYITKDAIVVIEKAAKAIKSEKINSCWRKRCPNVMHDFTGLTTEPVKELIKEVMDMEKSKKKKKVGK